MIFLSIGSNLSSKYGNRFENINLALSRLESQGIKISKKSSFYETPSYPDITLPKYINIAVSIKTNLQLIDLFSVLITVEKINESYRRLSNIYQKNKKINNIPLK